MECDVKVDQSIQKMAEEISGLNIHDPVLIGIHTGGVWVANELHRLLQLSNGVGTLDISFYRDDFSRVGLNPEVKSSELPESIEDRNIILIDDVMYTGRTIRAALNEIFSFGRPSIVVLGVLIDRSGRELPIQPDIVGCHLELGIDQQAKLVNQSGNLNVNIVQTKT